MSLYTYDYLLENGTGSLLLEGGGYYLLENAVAAIRVQAVRVGQYGGQTRNIGDVFDIPAAYFSDSSIDALNGRAGAQFLGWMIVVPSSTPLFMSAPTPLTTPQFNGSVAAIPGNVPRLVY